MRGFIAGPGAVVLGVAGLAIGAAAGLPVVALAVGVLAAGLIGPSVSAATSTWLRRPAVADELPPACRPGIRSRQHRSGSSAASDADSSPVQRLAAWRSPGETAVPTPAVATALAALYAAVLARFGVGTTALPALFVSTGGVAIAVVDLFRLRVPTTFVRLTGASVGGTALTASLLLGRPSALVGGLVGATTYTSLLLTVALLIPDGLGRGDVRLAGVLGLALGWYAALHAQGSLVAPVMWVALALLLASVAQIAVHLATALRRPLRIPLPLAPVLVAGAITVIVLA